MIPQKYRIKVYALLKGANLRFRKIYQRSIQIIIDFDKIAIFHDLLTALFLSINPPLVFKANFSIFQTSFQIKGHFLIIL